MANDKINDCKETMRLGMIENFKRFGFLTPVVFFLQGEQLVVIPIPGDFLTPIGKQILAGALRKICQQPNVLVGGLIIEAYGAKMKQDSNLAKLVSEGNIRVSELKEKKDIIVMIFSTPENEEMFVYGVDVKNKSVGDLWNGESTGRLEGTFSNFFSWNKN